MRKRGELFWELEDSISGLAQGRGSPFSLSCLLGNLSSLLSSPITTKSSDGTDLSGLIKKNYRNVRSLPLFSFSVEIVSMCTLTQQWQPAQCYRTFISSAIISKNTNPSTVEYRETSHFEDCSSSIFSVCKRI